jgi:hypothetical protein
LATFIKRHWRGELVLLFSIILSSGVLWMENRADIPGAADPYRGYGGRMPDEVGTALKRMVDDVGSAYRIVQAEVNVLSVTGPSGEIRTYRFDGETLWQNDNPMVSGVCAFHFEYRDQWGNLLTQGGNDTRSIETVGYAIRILRHRREIASGSKVEVTQNHASDPYHSTVLARG